jgi:RNA polymerase sigma-70 factor, ECF subfamily
MTAPDLDSLYRHHVRRVSTWARRLGGPTLDVEDAVQEVFLIACRRYAEFEPGAKITTWLFRITSNVVRHQWRRRRFRHLVSPKAEAPPSVEGPVERLAQAEAESRLYLALESVRPLHREALILFELDEKSGEEIAELLGITVASVWTRLHRGRNELLSAVRRLEAREARSQSRKERRR